MHCPAVRCLFITDCPPFKTIKSPFITVLLFACVTAEYHNNMRTSALILACILTIVCYLGFRLKSNAHTAELPSRESVEAKSYTAAASKIDFATQIRPIFQSSCQPCHFSGGTMYQRLPFDRPETIKSLGPKLFTRIQDENKRRLIREFLSQE